MRDELADFLESQQQRALMNGGGNTHVRRMLHVVLPTFSSLPVLLRPLKIDDAHRDISSTLALEQDPCRDQKPRPAISWRKPRDHIEGRQRPFAGREKTLLLQEIVRSYGYVSMQSSDRTLYGTDQEVLSPIIWQALRFLCANGLRCMQNGEPSHPPMSSRRVLMPGLLGTRRHTVPAHQQRGSSACIPVRPMHDQCRHKSGARRPAARATAGSVGSSPAPLRSRRSAPSAQWDRHFRDCKDDAQNIAQWHGPLHRRCRQRTYNLAGLCRRRTWARARRDRSDA